MSPWTSLAFCSSLVACGDPLHGTDYFGTELLTMSGEVLSSSVIGPQEGEIRIALLWSPPGDLTIQADNTAELDTNTIINWKMTLYHPPSDELFTDSNGMFAAIGFPVLYLDTDGSQSWTEEWILGGSSSAFVLYLVEEVPDQEEPPPDKELPTLGYNVVSPPDCTSQNRAPPPTDSTQVNLEVGDLFFINLPDINCDGSTVEWDILCEYGCGDPS